MMEHQAMSGGFAALIAVSAGKLLTHSAAYNYKLCSIDNLYGKRH